MNKETDPPLTQAMQEIRTGGLSVLSDRAQDKIIDLLQWVAQDAYDRGIEVGKKMVAPKSKKGFNKY